MGNYISCTLAGGQPTSKFSNKGTKVIFPNGEIRKLYGQTKAAELMLESPNYFLVNSTSLQIGKRFNALSADEDLEPGSVYVFFPMKRVNAVVRASDLAAPFVATNAAASKRGGSSIGCVRISPECVAEEAKVVKSGDVEECEIDEELCLVEFRRQRLTICRSKKPVLETIVEERNTLLEIMMLD